MGTIGTPGLLGTEKYQIIVRVNEGVTFTAEGLLTTKTFSEVNGVVLVYGLQPGVWEFTVRKGIHARTESVSISYDMECLVMQMYFYIVPDFSYSGKCEIVNDEDAAITIGSISNWKIKFLTSGDLIFHDLRGQYIDIFLVGGGAAGHPYPTDPETGGYNAYQGTSGGGSGYTKTFKSFQAETGVAYNIRIAASSSGDGDYSRFSGGSNNQLTLTAEGGTMPYGMERDTETDRLVPPRYGGIGDSLFGGNGGSGGGGGHVRNGENPDGVSGNGGTDGGNGTDGSDGAWKYYDEYGAEQWVVCVSRGGVGQGYTTREFGEPTGKLYAPGGGGGAYNSGDCWSGKPGSGATGEHSGAGGNGEGAGSRKGQSGIVIVRNSRGQYGFGAGE